MAKPCDENSLLADDFLLLFMVLMDLDDTCGSLPAQEFHDIPVDD